MAKLPLTMSNLGPHTHFIKRRHTLKNVRAWFFLSNSLALTIHGDCLGGVIDLIWNLA
jgi:hypothetical protein